MISRKKFLLCLCVLAAAALVVLYRSQAPSALRLKKHIKYDVLNIPYSTKAEETVGLANGYATSLYVNNQYAGTGEYNAEADSKRVYETNSVTRLVNYTDGYQLDFPAGTSFDFSLSAAVTRGQGEGFSYTVSREYCPYFDVHPEMTEGLAAYAPQFPYEDGIDQYIGYYQLRFLLSQEWQTNNRVTVSQPQVLDLSGHKTYLLHAVIEDMPQDKYDAYSYVFIKLEGQDFLRIVVKYHSQDAAFQAQIEALLPTLRCFTPTGASVVTAQYAPDLPETWSQESASLYETIASRNELYGGLYTSDIYGAGIHETIPALEEDLDYRFQVVLSYMHSIEEFPLEFMEENWQQGRVVELTYQLTENNNENMYGYSPALDLYRGEKDEMIRELARQAKAFGHPFLLRICNEMNSDWTSYGGVVNMADPDLFIDNWRTIYRIFQEEGVDNCIWIYNPNDRNAPPSRWNDALCYYPGDEYVQMIGVTGYNNGTYYEKWAEEWREFDVIYDHIQNLYGTVYSQFPWIITEFASSSIGGDKAAWIDNMFAHIGNYPNIKIAVWFSSADYDTDGTVARPYWLDETPETVAAFKRGLSAYSSEKLISPAG